MTFPDHIRKFSANVPNHTRSYSVTYFAYNNSMDLPKKATTELWLKNVIIITQLLKNTDDI